MLSRFGRIRERDGQTDGRTGKHTGLMYQYRASLCSRAYKTRLHRERTSANANLT